jgi:hypothetical protein
MTSHDSEDTARELVGAWIEDEMRRSREVHVSFTMRERLAYAIRLAFAAKDAEIARILGINAAEHETAVSAVGRLAQLEGALRHIRAVALDHTQNPETLLYEITALCDGALAKEPA